MSKLIIKLLVTIILILSIFGNSFGHQRVMLTIKVLDCCGQPISGACVVLFYKSGEVKGSLRLTDFTDDNGLVTIQTWSGRIELTGQSICRSFCKKTIQLESDTLVIINQKT